MEHYKEFLKAHTYRTIDYFPGACIIWAGRKNPKGYGVISSKRGNILAHRAAYTLFHGSVPKGLWILHRCNNSSCVNVDHLYAGTAKDNAIDRAMAGRTIQRYFDNEDIIAMREARKCGVAVKEIASIFGVESQVVYTITLGQNYKEVGGPIKGRDYS